jgi:hypothetical protein
LRLNNYLYTVTFELYFIYIEGVASFMSIYSVIKFLFSFLELFVTMILTMSLFRFPLKFNYYKYFIISIIMTSISFYLRDIVFLNDYAILSMLISETILITILFNLPVYYSLFISVIGLITAGIMEYGVVTIGTLLGLTNAELINQSYLHSSIIYLVTSIINLIIIVYIRYRKFGFMFVTNKMTMRQGIKRYNFAISAILVLGMLIIQLISLSYNTFTIHAYVLIGLCLVYIIAIYIAYKHNKKLLKDKYERLKNR